MNHPNFLPIEIGIIRNMLLSKSPKAIAKVIDRPEDEIRLVINRIAEEQNLTPYKEKISVRTKEHKVAKAKVKRVSKAVKQEQKRLSERHLLRQKAKEEALQRESARKNRRHEPSFKTKAVDYSQMKTLRIDRKTVIYIKPGEDPEKKKSDFLKNYKVNNN